MANYNNCKSKYYSVQTDPNEWRKVFYIASAVYIAGNLFYLIFGTSEMQKWNEPDSNFEGKKTYSINTYEFCNIETKLYLFYHHVWY